MTILVSFPLYVKISMVYSNNNKKNAYLLFLLMGCGTAGVHLTSAGLAQTPRSQGGLQASTFRFAPQVFLFLLAPEVAW